MYKFTFIQMIIWLYDTIFILYVVFGSFIALLYSIKCDCADSVVRHLILLTINIKIDCMNEKESDRLVTMLIHEVDTKGKPNFGCIKRFLI